MAAKEGSGFASEEEKSFYLDGVISFAMDGDEFGIQGEYIAFSIVHITTTSNLSDLSSQKVEISGYSFIHQHNSPSIR